MKYIAYTIAASATLLMMLIFINMGQWMQMVARLPFMKIDPSLSGGAVVDSIVNDNATIYIHETTHPGLFEDKSVEITQIDIQGEYDGTIKINGNCYMLTADGENAYVTDSISGKAPNHTTLHGKKGLVVRMIIHKE